MDSVRSFENAKSNVLRKVDYSNKGSFDSAIVDILEAINLRDSYVSLSSCSGRINLISYFAESNNKKKDCVSELMSHEKVDSMDVLKAVKECDKETLMLKFEPLIIHILCRSLEDAKHLQDVALACGFKNSGLIVGKNGKMTFSVRSTLSLEVPLRVGGELLVSDEFIVSLVRIANDKMDSNFKQIEYFRDKILNWT